MDVGYQPPFDFDGLVAWLGARAIPGVESVEGGVYTRGRVRVWREGEGLRTNGQLRRVRRLFDAGADPAAIHAVLARDRMLAPLLHSRPGVRVPGAWDPFELAVRAIVGQQVSVAGARTILGRIAANHGLDAQRLSEVTVEGMPRRRAETIRSVARAVLDGDIVLDAHAAEPLREIAGIGPWTASYITMRLGDGDAFPAGDLVLRRNAGGLSERQLLQRAEPWRPFRAYAAMLLWMG